MVIAVVKHFKDSHLQKGSAARKTRLRSQGNRLMTTFTLGSHSNFLHDSRKDFAEQETKHFTFFTIAVVTHLKESQLQKGFGGKESKAKKLR
jgi:hypothetical protein